VDCVLDSAVPRALLVIDADAAGGDAGLHLLSVANSR
jgi:hypothetical protein